jgi:AbrB family looped-hinge helix DNA binding protein
MELAKITSQGQITIPADIRRYLNIKSGDKVVLIKENGRVVMANSAMLALKEAQEAFSGVADNLGVSNEDDVVTFIKNHRKSKKDTL